MHCDDPCIEDRCISFKYIDLRIPLQLNGILSCFNSRKPLPSELYDKDKIFITPDRSEWNPHCPSYSHNAFIMTNYEGEMANPLPPTIDKELTFDPDELFELATVQTTDYDAAVDSAITSSFEAESQNTSSYDTDAGFASCLNAKVE